MKIGIVTFHSVNNYGAVLQAYALQTYLEARGHEVLVVDYRPRFLENRKPSLNIVSLRSIYRCLSYFQLNRTFERFRRLYLKRTQPYFSLEELRKSPPDCDVYITGSDQVWSPIVDGRNEVDYVYFLAFGDKDTRRIAYAASFGVKSEDIPSEYFADIQKGLANIDAISVREKSGINVVHTLNNSYATWCLDPIFLKPDGFDEFAGVVKNDDNFVFIYMIPQNENVWQAIRAFAQDDRIRMFDPLGQKRFSRLQARLKKPLSPTDWISSLNASRYVITSSFHGVAFSILRHKPFIYIFPKGRDRALAERVFSLLERLGLQNQCVAEDTTCETIREKLSTVFDWMHVDMIVKDWRSISEQYLNDELTKIRRY